METSFWNRLLLFALLLTYNYFFWAEKLGLNLLIFTVFLYGALYVLNTDVFKTKQVIFTMVGTLVLSALVVYNNTLLSKFIFFSSLVTSLGFIHQKELKSIMFAIPTGLLSFAMFPYVVLREVNHLVGRFSYLKKFLRKAKLVIFPLTALVIFYVIYVYANPIFAEASDYVWTYADNFIVNLFVDFPFGRMFFILFGVFLISGFLYNCGIDFLREKERDFADNLTRKYNPFFKVKKRFKTLALLDEMRSAVILLVMMNLLIAILNYIDITYIWFGFNYYPGFDLRQFVHTGTYLLIVSIILSILIQLYYFRGNLNFYSGNKWMRYLAYMWIFQNSIMAVSVGVRNYYYIFYSHSLAYKRIGLIIFLLLTVIGLVTLFIKIKNKQTIYHLLKVNSIAAYLVLFISCFFNWGVIIAEYNLSNPDKDKIHYEFLLDLSDETLPILDRHKDLIDRKVWITAGMEEFGTNGLEYFIRRRNEFMTEYRERSWLSWNYADWKTYEYFYK